MLNNRYSSRRYLTNLKGGDLMIDAAVMSSKLLNAAIKKNASDIHFYPSENNIDVYFRVQGKRKHYRTLTRAHFKILLTYFKFTSGMDIGEIRKPQNGTITHIYEKLHYALRLSTLPVYREESLAIRILPQDEAYKLDELFLFPFQLARLKKWTTKTSGLILVTGPTGSGKTTTLYALLQEAIRMKSIQAISLEDPIEKEMNNMLQVQINKKAGITYQTGLKAALRHDPDILMVGEIRDQHVAAFALEASLTGHLVLSTLHAENAVGTIYRLLDMGISPIDLEQSLIAIASLELLPLKRRKNCNRRAAIMELLEGESLKNIINSPLETGAKNTYSFKHLRKKAYAYGFISEEVYEDATE